MDIQLDETEARILGCLLEKERTTPDAYPLTLNALQMACNQKSSRKPVMSLTTSQIEAALDGMRYGKHLVYQVSQAGSRVPKYKHNIEKIGAFSEADSAILGVLMLRGSQTASEVKTHCERLHHFDGRDEVEVILEELRSSESGPFVHLLPREHGRRERRYTHLLSGAAPVGATRRCTRSRTGTATLGDAGNANGTRPLTADSGIRTTRRTTSIYNNDNPRSLKEDI
jgi:uncharacterized protein